MARPLRIEFPGACYHVIQRGNFRFPVFERATVRKIEKGLVTKLK